MTPTLGIFRQALQTPDLSLATLTEARAATGADGMPRLMRTTRFAEAEISWHGAHWLLFMPLSPAALASVERTASQTARLNTELLVEYRILPGELRWVDASDVPRATSLILQRLPEGRTFDEALLTVPAERLAEALGELRDGLGKLGFSHNNLRPENLRWTGTRFVPLRYHDARLERRAATMRHSRRCSSGSGSRPALKHSPMRQPPIPPCLASTATAG